MKTLFPKTRKRVEQEELPYFQGRVVEVGVGAWLFGFGALFTCGRAGVEAEEASFMIYQ